MDQWISTPAKGEGSDPDALPGGSTLVLTAEGWEEQACDAIGGGLQRPTGLRRRNGQGDDQL